MEMKPTFENRVTLDTKAKDYFGNPGINLFVSETDEDVRTVARGKKIVRKIYADLGIEEIGRIAEEYLGSSSYGDLQDGSQSPN